MRQPIIFLLENDPQLNTESKEVGAGFLDLTFCLLVFLALFIFLPCLQEGDSFANKTGLAVKLDHLVFMAPIFFPVGPWSG